MLCMQLGCSHADMYCYHSTCTNTAGCTVAALLLSTSCTAHHAANHALFQRMCQLQQYTPGAVRYTSNSSTSHLCCLLFSCIKLDVSPTLNGQATVQHILISSADALRHPVLQQYVAHQAAPSIAQIRSNSCTGDSPKLMSITCPVAGWHSCNCTAHKQVPTTVPSCSTSPRSLQLSQ